MVVVVVPFSFSPVVHHVETTRSGASPSVDWFKGG
jgi:hypothetical protein